MEAWRSQFASVRASYWQDNKEDDANKAMALEHLEYVVDSIPHKHTQASGLQPRKSPNIDYERVLMDKQLERATLQNTLFMVLYTFGIVIV